MQATATTTHLQFYKKNLLTKTEDVEVEEEEEEEAALRKTSPDGDRREVDDVTMLPGAPDDSALSLAGLFVCVCFA